MLLSLIGADRGSVNSDDITNTLRDWKVFEPVRKHNKGAEINVTIFLLIDVAAGVGNLEGTNVLVRLKTLVRELGVKNSCVKVDLIATWAG